jgi:hypothetical protein
MRAILIAMQMWLCNTGHIARWSTVAMVGDFG